MFSYAIMAQVERNKEKHSMSDRQNIYQLLEEAHNEAFPHETVGDFLKELNDLIGPFDQLEDGEFVTRLSGYIKSPFHRWGINSK